MTNGDDAARQLTARLQREAAGARVIWDFDGVVGHTEPLHEASYRELAERRCVVLEDSDAYLVLGRELGAFTVGVRHSHNPRAVLDADLTTHL